MKFGIGVYFERALLRLFWYFLKKAREVTGFKPVRVNCWEINQLTSKCWFFGQNLQKRSKIEKLLNYFFLTIVTFSIVFFYTIILFDYNIWLFSHSFVNLVILVKIWNFNLKSSSLIMSVVTLETWENWINGFVENI